MAKPPPSTRDPPRENEEFEEVTLDELQEVDPEVGAMLDDAFANGFIVPDMNDEDDNRPTERPPPPTLPSPPPPEDLDDKEFAEFMAQFKLS